MKTYDSVNDVHISECIENEAKEMEYFETCEVELLKKHYNNLYIMLEHYDTLGHFDFSDWLTAKTHWVFSIKRNQWESWTLELISEGE